MAIQHGKQESNTECRKLGKNDNVGNVSHCTEEASATEKENSVGNIQIKENVEATKTKTDSSKKGKKISWVVMPLVPRKLLNR